MNPAIGPQNAHFWQSQEHLIQEAEKFTSAWFKRRHEATRATFEAFERLTKSGSNDPATMINVMTEWQAHSMERLAEDATACTQMLTRCAGSLLGNEIEALKETTENTKRATSHKAIPV